MNDPRAPLVALARKETRALLPVWLATLGVLLTSTLSTSVISDTILRTGPFPLLAYVAGVMAIGALSMGHEYAGGTLSSLLAAPVRRPHIFMIKVGVATTLIAMTALTAWWVALAPGAPLAIVLPPLGALLITPWLTMLSRSALAGALFTVSGPAVIFVATQVVVTRTYGLGPEATELARTAWFGAMMVMAPTAAVLGWRRFMRLEAIDGDGQTIHMPAWLTRRQRVQRQHPAWVLVKKEIYLQQIAFVITGIYLAAWVAVFWGGYLPESPGRMITVMPMTIIYFLVISVLVGSLASAEERQHGTREWQLLLPIAASTQWAVKCGVALLLALLLGLVLPTLLIWLSATPEEVRYASFWWYRAVVPILVITTASLYLSSLAGSGMRALAIAGPVLLVAVAALEMISWSLSFGRALLWPPRARTPEMWLVAIVVVLALLLWFGFVNHRAARTPARRVAMQIAAIAGLLIAATVVLGPI